ncbi:putative membrane protein YqhA [Devosia sp. UYZn731]|uniref:YqhA family protein n=1 Tax=Devosia sp. UYZn731 TaxID=3156345 RepID=UPI00339268ED
MAEPEANDRDAEPRRRGGPFVIGGIVVRVAMLIPVIALSVASVALIVYGAFETRHFVTALFHPDGAVHRDEIMLVAIELVDLFLLATVVQVVALGLYQLYFRQDLQLPKWLKVETLDDLKSKLVGVTVTVLAVYFLGRALTWETGADIAYLGIGVALVIVALTWFLGKIDNHE